MREIPKEEEVDEAHPLGQRRVELVGKKSYRTKIDPRAVGHCFGVGGVPNAKVETSSFPKPTVLHHQRLIVEDELSTGTRPVE